MQLKNLMESHAHRITQKQCEELIADFAVNDERGEIITLDLAFLGQFHAHWYVNSAMIRGKPFNYYFGKADGSNGAYPIGRTSIVLTPEGYFDLDYKGNLKRVGGRGRVITADENRAPENPILTAFHRQLAYLHNKRMDEHGDYERAKAETVACYQHAFMDMTEVVTGLSVTEILDDVRIENVSMSLEAAHGIGRYGHVLMPDTFNGFGIFDSNAPVDLAQLNDEYAGRLGLRVCRAMNEGSTGGKGQSILKHTIAERHNRHKLCTFVELAEEMGFDALPEIYGDVPIFYGMMLEAQSVTEGDQLGPIGARAVADLMASTLDWGRDTAEGLWHPRWDGAPSTVIEIEKYIGE